MTRVTGIDVMMLYGETPAWQMHVSALMIADPSTAPRGFDPATFKSLLAERLALAPQLRCKVQEVAHGLDRPVLVDDGEFDLDRHFHHVAVPAPGDNHQLGRLIGTLMSRPLDRSRALWELWLIEGLERGRVATLTKVHHALVDGASGVRPRDPHHGHRTGPAPRGGAEAGTGRGAALHPLGGVRGDKVNDVVLSMVSGALRSYLLERGELPGRSLVAEMPVDIRTEQTRRDVGTRVANSFVTLATDVVDPVERLRTIHRSSADAKSVQRDLGAHKRIDLSDVLPPVLVGAALRGYSGTGMESMVPPIYSVIVSNVRGPEQELYVGGARLVGIYPMGPLLYGSGLNITALTLGDRVHFGLTACPDLVADPWGVADLLPRQLADLVPETVGS